MADENEGDLLNPDDIEALLNSSGGGEPAGTDENAEETADAAGSSASGGDADTSDDSGAALDASEIEALLDQQQQDSPMAESAGRTEQLLNQAEMDLAAAVAPDLAARPNLSADLGQPEPFDFADFPNPAEDVIPSAAGLESLEDVELDLRIELGRTELLVEEVLRLKEGAVVPLDKLAGDPVDILVNGRIIARGEVLVLNDNFCVRVAEILTPMD